MSLPPDDVSAVLLAAGASTRFGSPKMLVDVEGELWAGGTLSVLVPVSPALALGLAGELHALDDDGDSITYGSLAAGLRWSPRY